jgi:hypothetical protein
MPNWVYNSLTVTADDPEVITKVVTEVRGTEEEGAEPISFQSIIPRPAEKESDWYAWNIENWGTKWDACNDVQVDHDGTIVSYSFDTAWAPPIPIVKALSERYPETTVELSYEEEQGWGGEVAMRNGETLEETSWDIPQSHRDVTDRGADCRCHEDEQAFDDCFYWQAVEQNDAGNVRLSPTALALIKGLSAEWQGNLDTLIETAQALETNPARSRP